MSQTRTESNSAIDGSHSAGIAKATEALSAHGLEARIRRLEDSARTAQAAADAIGCALDQIVKSLVFKEKSTGAPVLILVSGGNRVAESKVGKRIGQEIAKADAEYVRAKTGYAIGGVAPLGHPETLQTLVDEDLMGFDELWAAAGHPSAVFRLTPHELVRITGGTIVPII
ncbi:MAG: YbaK/EbsC family protein [Gammaproteobacteria bacterium]|nr:YbaK/EbsC family protein [Gammaproteobacteria bacterium]